MSQFIEPDYGVSLLSYEVLLEDHDWITRRGVAQALYEGGHPEAARLLRKSLADPDERVRLFAAQALELIAERHQNAISRFRNEIREQPENGRIRIDIARQLWDYAVQCVESKEVRRHIFTEAREHLNAAVQEGETTPATLMLQGKILFRLEEYNAARSALESIKPSEKEYARARFLLAEIWLAEGFPQLTRKECERIKDRPLPPDLRDAVDFWCEN